MTAQGVMAGAAQSGPILSGFFAQGSTQRNQKDISFEEYLRPGSENLNKKAVVPDKVKGKENEQTVFQKTCEQAKKLFSKQVSGKNSEVESVPKEELSEEDFEELAEAVSAVLNQVKTLFCESFDLSKEELADKMQELSISDADLLTDSGLKTLFLSLNQDAVPEDLLTNESLFDSFANLMQAVEQTVAQSEVSREQCSLFLKEMETQTEQEPENELYLPNVNGNEEVDSEKTESNEEPLVTEQSGSTSQQQKLSDSGSETESRGKEKHFAAAKETAEGKEISTDTDRNLKNVFIDAMSGAVAGNSEDTIAAAAEIREIANQVMEQIKLVIRPEQTNLELQLNPEHLGRVHLTITEKEGMMTAQFTTQTEVAKEAIESQMSMLRESLQNQGIKVEAMEVTVSNFSFDQERENRQRENSEGSKRRRQSTFSPESSSEADENGLPIFGSANSNVDYSA